MKKKRRKRNKIKRRIEQAIRIGIVVIGFLLIIAVIVFAVRRVIGLFQGKMTRENVEQTVETISQEDTIKQKVNSYIQKMTLEEKVAQLFFVKPESMTKVKTAVQAGDTTKQAINTYPVGGFIYFSDNIQSKEQLTSMISNTQQFMQERMNMKAFIGIDEEGGEVARISGNQKTGVPAITSMNQIGASGDTKQAYEVGKKIGSFLTEFGVNLDFAPVADISNIDGSIMTKRAFGTDANLVASMVSEEIRGFQDTNIICVLKHFPGLGYTQDDTHLGYVRTDRTKEEMQSCEFIPFIKGIETGVPIVMVGHIAAPNLTGDDTPCSLSKTAITDILRGELQFDGVVVTDALGMQSISKYYTSEQAAVKAIEAGVDILLMPEDFESAYQGVLNAVQNETISQERIEGSLQRILLLKAKMGLLE